MTALEGAMGQEVTLKAKVDISVTSDNPRAAHSTRG